MRRKGKVKMGMRNKIMMIMKKKKLIKMNMVTKMIMIKMKKKNFISQ